MTATETPRHQAPEGPPLVCGHRGFTAKFPENTLLAFNATVDDANCRIIETDVHLTKDRVIVINHDADTARIYGQEHVIRETEYDPVLKNLRNKSPPHEPILTFKKALQWLAKKNDTSGNVKFMLDIKGVNPVDILDVIVEEMLAVHDDVSFWHDKIIFGLWLPAFYEYGVEKHLLDGFEIVNITFSMAIAQKFLAKSEEYENTRTNFQAPVSGVSLQRLATWGANYDDSFIKFYELLVNKLQKDLYLWTCNNVSECEFYYQLGIKGFLTDHPDLVKSLVDAHDAPQRPLNLYEFYRYNDPVNFHTTQGLKNYATYKTYKAFEYAALKGYLTYKIPATNYTVGQYSMKFAKIMGII